MEEGMKKNILIIISALLAIFIITFLCVKFINKDIFPEKNKDNSQTDSSIKGVKNETVKLNDKDYNLLFRARLSTTTEKDEETGEEYTNNVIKYEILLNNKFVNNVNIEDYIEDINSKVEINEVVKKIKGNDDKEYLVIKLVTHNDFGITNENILIINDNNELLFKYLHEISSIFYEIKGENSDKYIIGQNNCEDFKYIDTGETLCKDFDNLYSTYKIEDDKIELLECLNSGEFDGKLKEKELKVENDTIYINDSETIYEINDAGLSGAGFICPKYNVLSK